MPFPKEEYLFMDNVPDSWTIERFGDLFLEPLCNGIYKEEMFHGSGTKMINMGEIFNFDFISNQEMQRVELDDSEKERFCVQEGDLLFARRSLVLEGSGKCSYVAQLFEQTAFESSIICVRLDKNKANPLFYYYLFKSPLGRGLLLSIAVQTAVSGIKGSDLKKLKVPYPPKKEQDKFVEILNQYDIINIKNDEKILLLEKLGNLLFNQIFIQSIINDKTSLVRFKEQKIFNIIKMNIKKYDGLKEYYATANVVGIELYKSGLYYQFDELPSRAQKIPEMNSIWFARMKNSRKIIFFNKYNELIANNSILSSGFVGLKTKEEYLPYLFFLINSEFFNATKDAYCTGATQESLNNDNLRLMKIILPDKTELDSFRKIAEPIMNSILLLQLKNDLLKEFQIKMISLFYSDKNKIEILDEVEVKP